MHPTELYCINRSLECLRDLGLEDDAMSQATKGPAIQAFRWCRSMVGEEYGRLHYWGSHPDTMVCIAK